MTLQNFWDPIQIETKGQWIWKFDAAVVTLTRQKHEWIIQLNYPRSKTKKQKLQWLDASDHTTLQALPQMPALPLCLNLKQPFSIPANNKANWNIHLPMFMRFKLNDHINQDILIPTQMIPYGWFGSPTEGHKTLGMPWDPSEVPPENCKSNQAICHISLKNETDETLTFDRLCVFVEHLGLYRQKENWVTDGLSMIYKGKMPICKMQYSKTPFEAGQERITPPQNLIEKSVVHNCLREADLNLT